MEKMYENWVMNAWENPMKDEKAVWLDSVLLNRGGLILKFDSDNAKYIFKFSCLSPVRIIDEGYRVGLWDVMKNQGILGKSPTWIVNHSDFIEDLDSNGGWSHLNPASKHYLFITADIVIDVASSETPEILKETA